LLLFYNFPPPFHLLTLDFRSYEILRCVIGI